jgi:hypothetical protein
MFFSAFGIQHCRQTGGARAGGRDFGSNSVAQPRSVKPVATMSDVFDCPQVHYRMPSDLDERIAALPPHENSQGIVSGKLFPYRVDPSAPIPSQHRYNFTAGEQADPVTVYILDWQQVAV